MNNRNEQDNTIPMMLERCVFVCMRLCFWGAQGDQRTGRKVSIPLLNLTPSYDCWKYIISQSQAEDGRNGLRRFDVTLHGVDGAHELGTGCPGMWGYVPALPPLAHKLHSPKLVSNTQPSRLCRVTVPD